MEFYFYGLSSLPHGSEKLFLSSMKFPSRILYDEAVGVQVPDESDHPFHEVPRG